MFKMFKSCLNSCLYEDRTTSCIGLQNYAPPLQNHQPCNMASLQNRLSHIEGSTSTNLEAIQKFVQMLFTGYFRSLSICECGI